MYCLKSVLTPCPRGILVTAPEQEQLLASAPAQLVFGHMVNADCQQAVRIGDEHQEVVCTRTGGMFYEHRMKYWSSYYLEGLTWSEEGGTYVIQSTPASNRASREPAGFPYNRMEVLWAAGDVVLANHSWTRAVT